MRRALLHALLASLLLAPRPTRRRRRSRGSRTTTSSSSPTAATSAARSTGSSRWASTASACRCSGWSWRPTPARPREPKGFDGSDPTPTRSRTGSATTRSPGWPRSAASACCGTSRARPRCGRSSRSGRGPTSPTPGAPTPRSSGRSSRRSARATAGRSSVPPTGPRPSRRPPRASGPAQLQAADHDDDRPRPPLPRVDHWEIWNEPNQGAWLAPQHTRHKVGGRRIWLPTSPRLYRALADQMYAGLQATGPRQRHHPARGDGAEGVQRPRHLAADEPAAVHPRALLRRPQQPGLPRQRRRRPRLPTSDPIAKLPRPTRSCSTARASPTTPTS